VEQVVGILPRDPAVGLASDDGWLLSIEFFGDSVWSGFEAEEIATISATEWHDYRLESEDMRTYRFYIDGEFAHQGSFFEAFTQSSVSWGDLVRGAASKHRWDYIRFGAVPEPNVLLALTIATVALRRR
jgi:hypothetical protein